MIQQYASGKIAIDRIIYFSSHRPVHCVKPVTLMHLPIIIVFTFIYKNWKDQLLHMGARKFLVDPLRLRQAIIVIFLC